MPSKISDINKIKREYDRLYESFLWKKKLIRPTELGYAGFTSADAVSGLFKKIHLERCRSFMDLGSGDGKVVLIASLFTKAAGIEIDDELVKAGEKIRKKLRLRNAKFIKSDFLDQDLSKHDILFINPDKPMYDIERKLRNEMKEKSRLIVLGALYKPLNMKLEKSCTVEGIRFSVYKNE